MTVKKWDYFTDALLAGQQSHFLFIDFSAYDFYYFCEISGVLFLLFSLSSRSRSAWDFLR